MMTQFIFSEEEQNDGDRYQIISDHFLKKETYLCLKSDFIYEN
jgi:hypothetical protein